MNQRGMICAEDNTYAPKYASRAINNDQSTLCDLSHFGLIRARGSEARKFLQNQFSNDVNTVSPTQSQLSAYCTPKGRVISLFRVLQLGDDFYLHLPRSRIAATLQRLRMYIMMADVKLEDVSDQWAGIGVAGSKATSVLQTITGSLPTIIDSVVVHQQSLIVCMPIQQRYLILAGSESAIHYWNSLASHCHIIDSNWWSLQDIRAGLPQVFEANVEAFVPQMLNLDLVNGLSFRKGCYPGQEIVARTRYLGKVKRRMFRGALDSVVPPTPGTDVVIKEDGAKVGTIVQGAAVPGQGSECLAVLQISATTAQTLLVNNSVLILKDLPYSVEESEE